MSNLHSYNPEKKPHAMIDIETLSTKTNSVIFCIACIIFDPFKKELKDFVIDKMRVNICHIGQDKFGLETDKDSILFWKKTENKRTFEELNKNQVFIKDALLQLSEFISKYNVLKIWSNSPNFDMVILNTAFEKCDMVNKIPWKYWQYMDVRTVVNLGIRNLKKLDNIKEIEEIEKNILEHDKDVISLHDPLYDCYFQICKIQKCLIIDPVEKSSYEGDPDSRIILKKIKRE